jgi:hypothetical protein
MTYTDEATEILGIKDTKHMTGSQAAELEMVEELLLLESHGYVKRILGSGGQGWVKIKQIPMERPHE